LKVGIGAGEAHLALFCAEILGMEPDEVLIYYEYDEIVKLYNQQHNIKDEDDEETDRDIDT